VFRPHPHGPVGLPPVSLRLRLAALAWLWGVLVLRAQPAPPSIPIPGGEAGVGFDDLRYSTSLGRLIVPAGRTGAIVLVDPKTWAVTRIGGFASSAEVECGGRGGAKAGGGGRGGGV